MNQADDGACRRFFVSGRVQGVFFRASTRQKALELGVTGFARNLSDGRVEVLACGPSTALAELEAWLWEGPPVAEVSDVQASDEAYASITGFQTA